MTEPSQAITAIEKQIDKALWDLEIKEQLGPALKVYQESEVQLMKLGITPGDQAYANQQRVLAYCLMRQGNILRQVGKPQQALELGEREVAAARASGDQITISRSLMSYGTNLIVAGKLEQGLTYLEDAHHILENGDSHDQKQGLGWYWILQVDLANAGMVKKEPAEVVEMAKRALDILQPIENWPGVARAYAGLAKAHEKLGEMEEAMKDRQEQEKFETKAKEGKPAD
jgi:tetratricopeptide (TPR) repeat protein